MKSFRFIALILILLLANKSKAQDSIIEITWDELFFEDRIEVWDSTYQAFYYKPIFTDHVKGLNSKQVKLEGFLTLMDISTNYYVFSKISDINIGSCYGRHNIDPAHLIQVESELLKKKNTNKKISITGTFNVNEDDIYQLNYILTDIKIVK